MDIVAILDRHGWQVTLTVLLIYIVVPRLVDRWRAYTERDWKKEDETEEYARAMAERVFQVQDRQNERQLEVIERNTLAYNRVGDAIDKNSRAIDEIKKAFQTEIGKITETVRALAEQVSKIAAQLVRVASRLDTMERRINELEKKRDGAGQE